MCKAPPLSATLQALILFFILTSTKHSTPHFYTALTANASPRLPSESNALCPRAPPPLPELKPSVFIDIRIYLAYQIIQIFKSTITSDPLNITQTWAGPDVCTTYKGFYCAAPPYNSSAIALAAIDFNGYGLGAPSINGLLSQLPDLAFFHANSNKFKGTVSSDAVSNLPYFYELDVSNNLLSGPFPVAVFTISKLSFLDLRFNSFSGSVPPQLFQLTKLEVLFINDNSFMQPLPENLWQTTVNYLTLANNRFTGSIPCRVGAASETLVEVLLLNNQLTGCLPREVGLLRNATVFDVGYNRLTGPIPKSFSCLGKVEQLNLAGNYLYGHVPEGVCRIGSLLNLSLSDNYFTSVGPACMDLIKKGLLDDRKNCILGRPMQRSPVECIAFFLKAKYHCPLTTFSYHSHGIGPGLCELFHFSEWGSFSSSSPPPRPPPHWYWPWHHSSSPSPPSPWHPSYSAFNRHRL